MITSRLHRRSGDAATPSAWQEFKSATHRVHGQMHTNLNYGLGLLYEAAANADNRILDTVDTAWDNPARAAKKLVLAVGRGVGEVPKEVLCVWPKLVVTAVGQTVPWVLGGVWLGARFVAKKGWEACLIGANKLSEILWGAQMSRCHPEVAVLFEPGSNKINGQHIDTLYKASMVSWGEAQAIQARPKTIAVDKIGYLNYLAIAAGWHGARVIAGCAAVKSGFILVAHLPAHLLSFLGFGNHQDILTLFGLTKAHSEFLTAAILGGVAYGFLAEAYRKSGIEPKCYEVFNYASAQSKIVRDLARLREDGLQAAQRLQAAAEKGEKLFLRSDVRKLMATLTLANKIIHQHQKETLPQRFEGLLIDQGLMQIRAGRMVRDFGFKPSEEAQNETYESLTAGAASIMAGDPKSVSAEVAKPKSERQMRNDLVHFEKLAKTLGKDIEKQRENGVDKSDPIKFHRLESMRDLAQAELRLAEKETELVAALQIYATAAHIADVEVKNFKATREFRDVTALEVDVANRKEAVMLSQRNVQAHTMARVHASARANSFVANGLRRRYIAQMKRLESNLEKLNRPSKKQMFYRSAESRTELKPEFIALQLAKIISRVSKEKELHKLQQELVILNLALFVANQPPSQAEKIKKDSPRLYAAVIARIGEIEAFAGHADEAAEYHASAVANRQLFLKAQFKEIQLKAAVRRAEDLERRVSDYTSPNESFLPKSRSGLPRFLTEFAVASFVAAPPVALVTWGILAVRADVKQRAFDKLMGKSPKVLHRKRRPAVRLKA